MKISDLMIGIKLELEISDETGAGTGQQLISELEWAEDHEMAYIAAPIVEGLVYPVRVGSEMQVYFLYKFDAYSFDLYTFRARVTGRSQKENLALLQIQVKSDIERIQRRQFYRFECTVPVEYRKKSTTREGVSEEVPYSKACTRDMSGGGICILTKERLESDILLECRVQLDEGRRVDFLGRTVRTERMTSENEVMYSTGVLFDVIENKDREAIIHYIFKEQRKLRQKGLI